MHINFNNSYIVSDSLYSPRNETITLTIVNINRKMISR